MSVIRGPGDRNDLVRFTSPLGERSAAGRARAMSVIRGPGDRNDLVRFTSPLGERSAAGRVRGKGPSLIAAVIWIGAVALLVFGPHPLQAQPTPSTTHTPPRILAHYLPWYMAKPHSQVWGWHWTMGTFDPDGHSGGPPTIASHYHPIIGPYDSGDPDVLEYHALLMKLAGIDGVVIDWYGTVDYLDYAVNHRNTAAFVKQAALTGLEIAVCYEDQTIPKLVSAGRLDAGKRVEHARDEIRWLGEHWFALPAYLKVKGQPVVLSFGQSGLTDVEWQDVLAGGAFNLIYLSEHQRRKAAAGAFDWPSPRVRPSAQDEFYKNVAHWPVGMAVAYPRFHDIYEQAKVHPSWGSIDDNGGKTFSTTLAKALRSGLPLVQISTWNDWGEGTMIEPSTEFGYRDLEVIQRMRRQFAEPDFVAIPEDLRLPHRLYTLRKAVKNQPFVVRDLDKVAQLLSKRAIGAASQSLDSIERRRPKKR
jgi:Glycosyl hydrolase family 99